MSDAAALGIIIIILSSMLSPLLLVWWEMRQDRLAWERRREALDRMPLMDRIAADEMARFIAEWDRQDAE